MQLVNLDDAEQELPRIEFEVKGLDLQHGGKRPPGVGRPHIVRLEAKNRNDLEMKVTTELNVQTCRLGEFALDKSKRLSAVEGLDQGLACDHQDEDHGNDHREAPLSNRLHFFGSRQRNFGS